MSWNGVFLNKKKEFVVFSNIQGTFWMVQNFQLASFGSRVELEPAKFWLGSTRVTKNGLAPTLTFCCFVFSSLCAPKATGFPDERKDEIQT